MSLACEIGFTLNGKPVLARVPVTMTALEMIRDVMGLRGTKLGCGEGECGACTVLVDGISVNSCLMFAVDCEGRELTTIEGLRRDEELDDMQTLFVEHGAVQCGFCTPGLVMQAKYIRLQSPDADIDTIKRGIEGNLCRCTGYKKIVEAIAAATTTDEPRRQHT